MIRARLAGSVCRSCGEEIAQGEWMGNLDEGWHHTDCLARLRVGELVRVSFAAGGREWRFVLTVAEAEALASGLAAGLEAAGERQAASGGRRP
jgi:hypothetical protein